MKILFISDILLTGDFALRLKEEGNDVRLCILDEASQGCYKGLLNVYHSWRDHLDWVGKDGLIVFDDVGFGKEQMQLRKDGYTVFGGGGDAEKMETNRSYGHHVMSEHGLRTVPLRTFETSTDAIRFIRERGGAWATKFDDGHWLKPHAFIGEDLDGKDVISVLENYERFKINKHLTITLQERIFGVEIGVARYFNGKEFVGPIEYNLEHTHLFPGGKGPVIDEMGTLAWYATDENERLYSDTLKKLEPFLRESDFRGNFDVDCIVNESGAYPLEVTARLGAPIIHLHKTIHTSPWCEFLHSVASGKQYDLEWKEGFGVVTSVLIPPFPYRDPDIGRMVLGTKVLVRDKKFIIDDDRIHFDEVASHDGTYDTLYVAGTNGYPFYTTGVGKTVKEARQKSLEAINTVYVPRMFYRDDIGVKFEEEDLKKLQSWGYITNVSNKSKYSLW